MTSPQKMNTVGNVPMKWYTEFDHIGYDLDGNKIQRPKQNDVVDNFLSRMDDPNYWKSVFDEKQQQNVVLNVEDLDIINRITNGKYGDAKFDPFQKTVEWFTSKVHPTALNFGVNYKRRFEPSKHEQKLIERILNEAKKPQKLKIPSLFDLWEHKNQSRRTLIPAPKMKLPGHKESYNPPSEYCDETVKKYKTMREVPFDQNLIKDQFERLVDLFYCAREFKETTNIDPESLIPKLPDKKDLEPYPKSQALVFNGHTSIVRSISLTQSGQFMFSGSDDKTMKLWDTHTGRCLFTWTFDDRVVCVAVNPNPRITIVAAVYGENVCLINYGLKIDVVDETSKLFLGKVEEMDKIEWRKPNKKILENGGFFVLKHQKTVRSISWHKKGDYFTTCSPDAGAAAVLVHQVSTKQTQQPFKKKKGMAMQAKFHPVFPMLFVASQRYIRAYNLQTKQLVKKFTPNLKWISAFDIHRDGDNVIVSSFDKKVCWWDLDLGPQPYKTLNCHTLAVRDTCFHPTYPLFATCSDDKTCQIFYAKVFNDLATNPLLVPVKILKVDDSDNELGCISIQWHPTQPWLLSAGADHKIRLWV